MKNKTKNTAKTVRFITIRLRLRVFVFIFAGFILSSNIAAVKNGEHSVIALVLGTVFLCASFYENAWTFDLEKKQAIKKTGFVFFAKKRVVPFCAINTIEIEQYSLPARRSLFTEISMQLADGETILIEKDKSGSLREQVAGISEVQHLLKASAEVAAADFFDAAVKDILGE